MFRVYGLGVYVDVIPLFIVQVPGVACLQLTPTTLTRHVLAFDF